MKTENVSEEDSVKYEFTEVQNERIARFVSSLRNFSYFMFFGGACYSMMLVTQSLDPIARVGVIMPLVLVSVGASLVGMWLSVVLLRTADSFQSIVDTEGKDIPHLLDGLVGFGNFFHVANGVLWIMGLTLLGVVAVSLT